MSSILANTVDDQKVRQAFIRGKISDECVVIEQDDGVENENGIDS